MRSSQPSKRHVKELFTKPKTRRQVRSSGDMSSSTQKKSDECVLGNRRHKIISKLAPLQGVPTASTVRTQSDPMLRAPLHSQHLNKLARDGFWPDMWGLFDSSDDQNNTFCRAPRSGASHIPLRHAALDHRHVSGGRSMNLNLKSRRVQLVCEGSSSSFSSVSVSC